MWNAISNLVAPVADAAKGIFTSKDRRDERLKEMDVQVLLAKGESKIAGLRLEVQAKENKEVRAHQRAMSIDGNNHQLDLIAVRNMNQSLWDNFLALVFLAPFLMLICGPVIGFEHGIKVMEVLGDIKLGESFTMAEVLAYIWIGIAIVYFGLRGMAERLITSIFSKGKALIAKTPAPAPVPAGPSPASTSHRSGSEGEEEDRDEDIKAAKHQDDREQGGSR